MPAAKVLETLRQMAETKPQQYGSLPLNDPMFEKFVKGYMRLIQIEFFNYRDQNRLVEQLVRQWQFMQERVPGHVKVAVEYTQITGSRIPRLCIQILNDDRPFLLASLKLLLQRWNLEPEGVVHPIYGVTREAGTNKLTYLSTDADSPETGVRFESLTYVQIRPTEQRIDPEMLRAEIVRICDLVRLSAEDWEKTRDESLELTAYIRPHDDEGAELIEWLAKDHFIYFGSRVYDASGQMDLSSVRGIFRATEFHNHPEMKPHFLEHGAWMHFKKSAFRSIILRDSRLESITLRRPDGRQLHIVGMFTTLSYRRSIFDVPIIRQKARDALAAANLRTRSYDYKEILRVLEVLPRQDLMGMTTEDLTHAIMRVSHGQDRKRLVYVERFDQVSESLSAMIFLPKHKYRAELIEMAREYLGQFYGASINKGRAVVGEASFALIFFALTGPDQPFVTQMTAEKRREVEKTLQQMALSWQDIFTSRLAELYGEDQANQYLDMYERGFSKSYKSEYDPDHALEDLTYFEILAPDYPVDMRFYSTQAVATDQVNIKVFSLSKSLSLSKLLPVLQNLGFDVISERNYVVTPADGRELGVHDFFVSLKDLRFSPNNFSVVQQIFRYIWDGKLDNDGICALGLQIGLQPKQIALLQSFCRYLLQIKIGYRLPTLIQALRAYPETAMRLVQMFENKFDPSLRQKDRKEFVANLSAEIMQDLTQISRLDFDTVIRRMHNLIESTVRTNYFLPERFPGRAISFKVQVASIAEMPTPKPMFEVFIYSARLEAIHLRGAMIARGGIRLSDRYDDLRSEILDLMSAQMDKNAIIVPLGAKGGFLCKNLMNITDSEQRRTEVIACYQTMMRSLLDITDNRRDGRVVRPDGVLCYDQEDPYLVVAADKGTATFSDIANKISTEYDFWLGDAFASGGSSGYDHKKIGITARGAWESVKRHFREMGKDIQTEAFTVVGVGDMSGDVFGNGMLLSGATKLVAAFDHRDIFLDPNPDVHAAFAERQRLFTKPGSSWQDYDKAHISAGGGVYSRSQKSIELSAEMRVVLGVDNAFVTPDELIRMILRAPVELLWFGGIGTYIKASDESHAEARDHTNDTLRIDASEIRARVVGEGANLGMTQGARIEAGLRGIRLNTDTIDNSAGVDCSDHEVNIKIFLNQLEAQGQLSRVDRDHLLVQMTDDVAHLVLRDNYLQTQVLSLMEAQSRKNLRAFESCIRAFKDLLQVSMDISYIPNEEVFKHRALTGQGLTRPELARILAFAKITLTDQILRLPLIGAKYFDQLHLSYYPKAMVDRFGNQLQSHPLRNQIVAMMISNEMINRLGVLMIPELLHRAHNRLEAVIQAYYVVKDVLHLDHVWREIESLDAMRLAPVQIQILEQIMEVVNRLMAISLSDMRPDLDIHYFATTITPGIRYVLDHIQALLPPADARQLLEGVGEFESYGMPHEIATQLALPRYYDRAMAVSRIAVRHGDQSPDYKTICGRYFGAGQKYGIFDLNQALYDFEATESWQVDMIYRLVGELAVLHQHLTDQYPIDQEIGTPMIVIDKTKAKDLGYLSHLVTSLGQFLA